MAWATLNVFQRLTRHWDDLHPYNAAQVMKIAGRADRDALAEQWRATLREMELGPARVDGKRFTWEPLRECGLMPVAPGATLESLMTAELNRRFVDAEGLPFRAFLVEQGDAYYAGVVYHHWVADSWSIRLLLREWFLRVYQPELARRRPLRKATQGYWRLFGPSQAGWSIDEASLGLLRWTARFRRARRIEADGFKDLGVHFTLHHAEDDLIGAVAARAREMGVTVNDVFLAAIAEVCSERVTEPRNPRRHDLALGTIVDLRRNGRYLEDETFGLYLGFTSVFCRPDELANWDRLLAHVNEQNTKQKRTATAESSMMRMLAGLVFAKVIRPSRLLEFYRKRYALAGGISNVNLNRDWPAQYHPWPLIEYIRVSPCGPMMPAVFTPTTLGRGMNFGLTCRGSVVDPSRSAGMARMFLSRLRRFAGSKQ